MSALRKNEALQLSEVFVDCVTKEHHERLRMGKLNVLSVSINSLESQSLHFVGKSRNYYNSLKIDSQGRNKLISSEKGVHIAMFDELMDWAIKSSSE